MAILAARARGVGRRRVDGVDVVIGGGCVWVAKRRDCGIISS